jgi:recombination associated protein RdgC
MLKNLAVYTLANAVDTDTGTIENAIDGALFVECGPTQEKSVGFVPPRGDDHGVCLEVVDNRHLLMRARIQTRSVPADAVRKKALEAAGRIEQETGRKAGKKAMRELMDEAKLTLLPTALPRQADVWIWVDLATERLMLSTTTQGRLDDVITLVSNVMPFFAMHHITTVTAPQTAMTQWLLAEDPADWPADLTIERECELKSDAEEKSVVRFTRHNLDSDDVRKHIQQGKLPTKLALSFDGRTAFVLNRSLQLKKIDFLEGVFEERQTKEDKADAFDGDAAIATAELTLVIDGLVAALGGLVPKVAIEVSETAEA